MSARSDLMVSPSALERSRALARYSIGRSTSSTQKRFQRASYNSTPGTVHSHATTEMGDERASMCNAAISNLDRDRPVLLKLACQACSEPMNNPLDQATRLAFQRPPPHPADRRHQRFVGPIQAAKADSFGFFAFHTPHSRQATRPASRKILPHVNLLPPRANVKHNSKWPLNIRKILLKAERSRT